MHKKSQIQIGETIAVLFVFFILVVVGLVFYARVIKTNIESEAEELSQLQSVGVAQQVMFLPELQCSADVVTEVQNCIDILKLRVIDDVIGSNIINYFDLFGFSNVTVSQIYPIPTSPNEGPWDVYVRPLGNFTNKFVINVPVSLYYTIDKKYSFGILTIETFFR